MQMSEHGAVDEEEADRIVSLVFDWMHSLWRPPPPSDAHQNVCPASRARTTPPKTSPTWGDARS